MSNESRMAKILRRLGRKGEENQESTKQEETMSEFKDTRRQDADFDLGDIAGDVSSDGETKKAKPFESLKQSSPMEKIKKTVDDHLDDSWICFIENGKLESRELHTCSAEDFAKWVVWMYPPAKEMMKANIRQYDKYEYRKSEFLNMIAFYTRMQKVFAEYGEKKQLHPHGTTKQEKKDGGKNE